MFNGKTKSDDLNGGPAPVSASASLIGAGTTMKGDISSNGDLRIDGSLVGNIHCTAKVVIGANGNVQGDIHGQTADIMGKVTGTIKVKDLLQLKGGSVVNGNLEGGKLQIEPTVNLNGQCNMSTPPAATPSGKTAESRKEAKFETAIA